MPAQWQDLTELEHQYRDVFSTEPRQTHLVQHQYHVPEDRHEAIEAEVGHKLGSDII